MRIFGSWAVASLAIFLGCGTARHDNAGAPAAAPPTAGARAADAWPAWACALGPLTGAKAIDPAVPAGVYQGRYDFRRAKFITMEHDISDSWTGAARISLGEDGAMSACVGIEDQHVGRVSRYASPDKQDHTNRSGGRRLLGLRGRWEAVSDGARLVVDHVVWQKCDAPEAEMSPYANLQLVCGLLPANDRLPTAALACRMIGQLQQPEELALELGANPRAGAWAMRYDVVHGAMNDPRLSCGPWLLLGSGTGLTIQSVEDPRADAPVTTFTAGVGTLDWSAYVDKPNP